MTLMIAPLEKLLAAETGKERVEAALALVPLGKRRYGLAGSLRHRAGKPRTQGEGPRGVALAALGTTAEDVSRLMLLGREPRTPGPG